MEHVRRYKELELDSVSPINHKMRPVRPCKELEYDPANFTKKKWSHPEDAVLICFERTDFNPIPFFSGQWRVRGIDYSRNALLLGEGGHQQMFFPYMQVYNPGIYPKMPFFVENVLEELDAPGEWYLRSPRRQTLLHAASRNESGRGRGRAGLVAAGRGVQGHQRQSRAEHHVAGDVDCPRGVDLF